MAKADLGGRLFVWGVEIASRAHSMADPPDISGGLFDSTFTEALEEAQNRGLVNDEGVADLVSLYRMRGAEAAQVALRRLQQRTHEGILAAIEAGETLRDFAARVQSGRAELGFEPASPHYLENVFRSSVQAAYSAGRHQGITDAVEVGAVDYVERRAIGDTRTRKSHLALDGKVWRASDPEWKRYAPPLLDGRFQYQCRCTHVARFGGDFEQSALDRSAAEAVRAADPRFDQTDALTFSDPIEMMRAPIT